mmetsp:Transcript_33130/g.48562  ORF Transcript_33130/g.48562 Transcript_33130/m.48562 type:complete len:309 (-) Transcript_33130:61-987(-)|eukprot:CAMPEP_0195522868 /NCGR_PEP_ID=MMETSP0794_2-20130614/21452_1 /TAXON_ID=515487 /ORGANISM="Stephanopyxis turris, Strain CCMP 815" /LENGTH=308 /DNA_ID=CAMNT_0040652727 /DNA_START=154 /DNA_END=1080 /DNA_ORIENTATION=+
MARGADAKARKKSAKKEARAAEAARLLEEPNSDDATSQPFSGGAPVEEDSSEEEVDLPPILENKTKEDESAVDKKIKKGQKKRRKEQRDRELIMPQAPSSSKGIKTAPLVLLVMLTGTTIIPGLLYASDWIGNMMQKHHVMGSLGHRLGVGASPKKRVLSFYEKHDPTKLDDVPKILSKHYGEYPKLVKRLERKYNDYGYFIGWEQDEAPMQLAKEKMEETFQWVQTKWTKHAPRSVKDKARNVKFNLSKLYRKMKRIWKKSIWPHLEPFFGVPDGGAAQKRKDAREAAQGSQRKKGRKNREHRDDEM